MKKFIFCTFLLFISIYVKSQTSTENCGSDVILQNYLTQHPEFQQSIDYHETTLNNIIAKRTSQTTSSTIYIPIVVHVIYPTGESLGSGTNISYAQIQSQIAALNKAFANNYSSPQSTGPNAINTSIQFCLAKIPSPSNLSWSGGSSEPGVMRYAHGSFYDHTLSASSANDLMSLTHLNSTYFPFEKYLNIWVVRSIDGLYPGAQGYAPNPLLAPPYGTGFPLDGVVIRADVFGDNTNNPTPYNLQPNSLSSHLRNEGKVLVHEVGHYLNLWHTFQNGCTGSGDYVGDTPPCQQPSSSICNSTPVISCSTNVQVENFMYYTLDPCWNTFTNGQSSRMNAFISASRAILVSNSNLAATGVAGSGSCISPILLADIQQNPSQPCINTSVNFNTPTGSGYETATWNWSFPGGTPSSSTLQNPTVTYPSAGTYNITLTATGASGSITNSIQTYVSNCTINDLTQANWYFGRYCAIDFSSGTPVTNNSAALPQTINSPESTFSYSDPGTGNLIFYTDGINVWNNNHIAFTTTLGGNPPNQTSVSQIIAVPFPGSPNQYFLLMPPVYTSGASFNFARIDMTGTGSVVNQGAVSLPTGITTVSELITAIPHCNGKDFWIIVHGVSADRRFYVYRLSNLGLTNGDLTQTIPDIYPFPNYISGSLGNLKGSPDGNKLAVSSWSGGVAIYNFNNSNGQITNEVSLVTTSSNYGCSFSPNSNYLFTTNVSSKNITRYDLLNNSSQVLGALPFPWGMKLGPDNSIYISNNTVLYLSSIPNPDAATPILTSVGVDFAIGNLASPNNRAPQLGLPNLVDAHPTPATPTFAYTNATCSMLVQFNAGSCFDSFTQSWDFGDGTTSNAINPSHTYAVAGTYAVKLILTTGSISLPAIIQNITIQSTTPPTISGPNQICIGNSANYSASPASAGYIWSISPFTAGSFSGPNTGANVTVNWVNNGALQLTAGSCANAAINVVVNQNPTNNVSSTEACLCNATANIITTNGLAPYTYVWNESPVQNGTTATSLCAGNHNVTVTDANGCSTSTSYNITVNPNCCTQGTVFNTTSGTATPGTYNLNSALILTGDLTLSNLTIFMGANAQIIVPNNLKLTLNSVHFLACSDMWQGIKCSGNNASIVLNTNTLIEDAITAIDLKNVIAPKSGEVLILNVNSSTFNKNFTSINIENYNAASDYPSSISGSVFTCRQLITGDHTTYLGAGATTYNWNTGTANAVLKNTTYNPSTPAVMSTGSGVNVTDQFSAVNYPESNLNVPHQNEISRQGILLNNVAYGNSTNFRGFVIGKTGTDYTSLNLFDHLNIGINAFNSNISSSNSAYQNMKQYRASSGPFDLIIYDGGIGIRTESSDIKNSNKLTVLPGSGTSYNKSSNFFFNNSYGIFSKNLQYADVQYALVHSNRVYVPNLFGLGGVNSGEYGIYVRSNSYPDIKLNNNYITNINAGISFYATGISDEQLYGQTVINNNYLQADYTGSATNRSMGLAIVADNLFNCKECIAGDDPNTITVNNNQIRNAFRGIKSSNWKQKVCYAANNTIVLAQEPNDFKGRETTQYGILHENNFKDIVNSNTITGFNATTKKAVYAIRARDNSGQMMLCNSTASTYEGFNFSGSQNIVTWQKNKMQSHSRGMHLNNTIIGQQGAISKPMDNSWQPLGSGWTGTNFQTFVTSSSAGTNASNSKLYVKIAAPLFRPVNNNGSPLSSSYNSSSIIITTGVNAYQCPTIFNPGGGGSGGNPTQIAGIITSELKRALNQIVKDSVIYNEFIPNKKIIGKQSVYALLKQNPDILNAETDLQNFYNQSMITNAESLIEIENKLSKEAYTLAENETTILNPQNNIETNTKNFYAMFAKYQRAVFTQTDKEQLLVLAAGCPDRDGAVVYQARVLHNMINNNSKHFEDSCATISTSRLANNPSPSVNSIEPALALAVYPNPNGGKCLIDLSAANINSMQLKVYDVNGRIIYEEHINEIVSELYELNLDTKNGIYFVEITDLLTELKYKQKLIIQK